MRLQTVGSYLFQALVAIVVLSLLAGQLLGQPLLLSFVTTNSMEPSIEPGDGFVALPPELAGEVEQGDVVVFDAEVIEGGGLTTHGVVGETEHGYITQGDNNPFPDQDSGEPPVRETDIAAVVWQPGDSVVTIPMLGTAVMGVQSGLTTAQSWLAGLLGTEALLGPQGLGYIFFAAAILLYLSGLRIEDSRRRSRNRRRSTGTSSRLFVLAAVCLVVGTMTAAMVVPAGSQEVTIVSSEFESDSPGVVEQGTSESIAYPIQNTGIVPMEVFIESRTDMLAVEPNPATLDGRSTIDATVTITAPAETGDHRGSVQEYWYIGLLPTPVIQALYEVHPWAPIGTINALVAVPMYIVGMKLLGGGRLRSRTRGARSLFSW